MYRHIGLIPDGNRRWARRNSMKYPEAYFKSMRRVVGCIRMFYNAGFCTCSVYLLSTANLSRYRDDLIAVLEAETILLSELLPSAIEDLRCRIIHAGRASLLPAPMRLSLEKLQEKTRHFSERTLYILMAYDPVDELNAAFELSKQGGEQLDIFSYFWVPERVDVLIRTAGGPPLLSNFLPIQCGYAQIYMIESFFPDCTDDEFLKVIDKAKATKMLYGH